MTFILIIIFIENVQTVWWVLGIIGLVASALIIAYGKYRHDAYTMAIARADEADKTIKTLEKNNAILEKENAELREEVESLSSELKTTLGIKVNELLGFWEQKGRIEARVANAESNNNHLKERIELMVSGKAGVGRSFLIATNEIPDEEI